MSISQNFPSTRPSLNLNFARSQKLDPRITFTRSSTATYTGGDGLIKTAATDTPRFDFNATTGECLGLLIEEARTNLITYSNDFTTWTKQAISGGVVGIIPNNLTSPDGAINATRYYVQTAGSSFYSLLTGVSVSASTSYTYSVFIKPGESTTTGLVIFDGVGNASSTFNLNTGASTGTYSSANTTIQSVGSVNYGNGWYRYFITFSSTLSGGFTVKIDLGTTTLNQGFYIWGAQLEAGAFPTSYIPTVASTVTRSADNASITGTNFSSWYNPSEGSILGVYDRLDNQLITSPSAKYPMIFLFGLYPDRIALGDYGGTTGQQFNVFTSPGTLQAGLITNGGVVTPINTRLKSVGAYKTNDFASVGYSGSVQTDTSGTIPTVSLARLGNENATDNYLNGHISQLTYYPVRLSNPQLQNLTK